MNGESIIQRTLRSMPGYSILQRFFVDTSRQHWARVVMNRETQKLISALQPGTLETLEISGNAWAKQPAFKSYKSVDYPEFNICDSILEKTFDLIIAEQVFEHLLWPYRAGRNVHRMLNPGGYFLITTPFLIAVHSHPVDCSRWTETGIKYFLAECGFGLERVTTGSWGNRACVRANLPTFRMYCPLFHSLRNEPGFPIVVWALARK